MTSHAEPAAADGLLQIFPGHRPRPRLPDESDLVALYDSEPPDPPTVRVQANMVSTVDGAVTGDDGLSGTISSPADKRIFSVLRSLADAIVVGAGTARAERYTRLSAKSAHTAQRRERGQGDIPALVLVTASGDVDLDRLAQAGDSDVIVHTSTTDTSVLADLRSFCGSDNVVVHPSGAGVAPHTVLDDLRKRGMTRILTEGGPSLLGAWMSAGVVDELCLTVTAMLNGSTSRGPKGILDGVELERPVGLRPLSLITDGSSFIHRFAVEHASKSSVPPGSDG